MYIYTYCSKYAANAKVATILGSIPASSDTVEYEGGGGADEAVLNKVLIKIIHKNPLY
jgi:hypothetical protein